MDDHNNIDSDEEYVMVEIADDDDAEEDDLDAEEDDSGENVENTDAFDDVRYMYRPVARSTRFVEMNDLVKDIVLPRLPAKSVARFASVSKEWRRWIQLPLFAHRQSYSFSTLSGFFCQSQSTSLTFVSLDKNAYGIPELPSASFLPEEVALLSSCNGLLLLRGFDQYYVCNPVTRRFKTLPPPRFFHGDAAAAVLVFDPSVLNTAADYHVVCVSPVSGCVHFDVYSSETGEWDISRTILVDGVDETSVKYNGFHVNKIVYVKTTRCVIALDMFSGLYEVITLPFSGALDGVLTGIKGELCYIGVSRVLKNEFLFSIYSGMKMDLKREVRAVIGEDNCPSYRVLPGVDGENVMIVVGGEVIYSCSTSDGSVEVVSRFENGDGENWSECFPYINSMVDVV